ncbi:tyrosine-protein phosphatase [Mucilaginibacter psychrotolerans]|uniref:protein-tyrosine-phosphatase n=1 Tax=Mucilaginibacter psychrotolerans TaxID=1524096 RepID=A0A4Y8SRI8_9SPHI|nr:CpsB/CapC family capsule biosynthesis tyrosine phosphatase [Mucilaginibacter psychrotolerans]TFF40954.1 capsular biosynthesis protein [Mucilaginibacter psychrotolerans]
MFGLFKKKEVKKVRTLDYAPIVVDMHSHVLPGIDDGAQTPEESIVLIRKMMELGISKIIATPHVMVDYYRNDRESIMNALTVLKAELVNQHIDITVEAAAEHYFDETFEKRIEERNLMTMGADNYVLFELSFINEPPNVIQMVQKMRDAGYKPILAHPERYAYMDIDRMRAIRSWGCGLQINTISLTGYYGKPTKKMAEDMVDEQIVDFISSDMHHPRHAQAFEDALTTDYVEKLLKDYPLKNKLLF